MKTKTLWGECCESYKYAIDAENVENIELVRFSGSGAFEHTEAFRFNNVLKV